MAVLNNVRNFLNPDYQTVPLDKQRTYAHAERQLQERLLTENYDWEITGYCLDATTFVVQQLKSHETAYAWYLQSELISVRPVHP